MKKIKKGTLIRVKKDILCPSIGLIKKGIICAVIESGFGWICAFFFNGKKTLLFFDEVVFI